MKRTSGPRRRTAIAGAGVVALTAATLALQSADAAPGPAFDPEPISAIQARQLATAIGSDMGPDTAGSYYDADSRTLVVNVLNETTAAKVRAAGAQARIVEHSRASLDEARATLRRQAAIPGTSWATDPRLNKVVVTADSTVKNRDLERLERVVSRLGDRAAAIRRSPGRLQPLITGGDAIWGDGVRCSLGFNVIKGGEPYFLTAGHCTNEVASWSATQGGPQVARTETSRFPGDDYGIAAYTTDTPHPSSVNLYNGTTQPITQAGDALVGQHVRRSGSTTRVHEGDVIALDATANYEQGTVEGLIQTTVCAEPGDSGGSLFVDDTALGLTSGGSGDCATGGETFYQPVTEALEATGSRIG